MSVERNVYIGKELFWAPIPVAEEVDRLRAALRKIDRLNDSPAHFNPDIEVVLRDVLKDRETTT